MTERRRRRVIDQGATVQPPAEHHDETPVAEAPPLAEQCSCPHLDREEWHDIESDWSDIAFIKTSTNAVMGVPVGFVGAKEELERKAEKAGATVPQDAMFLLGGGRFRRPVMLEVEDIPDGAKGFERPGGIAYTQLVPAPLGKMQKAVDGVESAAMERYGRRPDEVWVWYLTCRICSAARDFETLIIAHYREAG